MSEIVEKSCVIDTKDNMDFKSVVCGVWGCVPPITIPGTNLTLEGYSVAARKTNFYIPELKVMLDCGLTSVMIPDYIFITHCHSDHCYNLPMVLVDLGEKKIDIYVPVKKKNDIRDFINSTYVMVSGKKNPNVHKKYTLHGVIENTQLKINIRNKPWVVDVIKCYHTVPCIGYGFSEIRKKLKDEYKDLSGKEIGQLKREGKEVTNIITRPMFCYLGDTSYEILNDPILEKYPVIMIECTFILPEHEGLAFPKKHIHWSHIENYVKLHSNITFILYHFSSRYSSQEIRNFFKEIDINNVILWI